jgi:hypothetical protein
MIRRTGERRATVEREMAAPLWKEKLREREGEGERERGRGEGGRESISVYIVRVHIWVFLNHYSRSIIL